MKRLETFFALFCLFIFIAQGQSFQTPGTAIAAAGFIEFGDMNNDGFQDFILGSGTNNLAYYRNTGLNSFTLMSQWTNSGKYPAICDYNNDGYLDFFSVEANVSFNQAPAASNLYRNQGNGTFALITSVSFLPVQYGSAVWIDFDNDGKFDIFLTGYNGTTAVSALYKNYGNDLFSLVNNTGLGAIYNGRVVVADFDKDSRQDIFMTGMTSATTNHAWLYHNNGNGTFNAITGASFSDLSLASADVGDYDSDGYPDLLVTGNTSANVKQSVVYKNTGGNNFIVQTGLNLINITHGDAKWGDCDHDGDPDIFLGGAIDVTPSFFSGLYVNDGGGQFINDSLAVDQKSVGSVAWCDFDNDGDLDIFQFLCTWYQFGLCSPARFYKNLDTVPNSEPNAPLGLTHSVNSGHVTLSWDKATDYETPQDGLSYNLYIGTSPGGIDMMSPMSVISTGARKVTHMGNVSQDTSWTIYNLPNGTYYWGVQSIDNNFAGSSFATDSFSIISFNIIPAVNQISCSGLNDASVSITMTGGVSPYTYVWSTGETNDHIAGLSPGVYSVTVTDSASTQMTASYIIANQQAMNLTTHPIPGCTTGLTTGQIHLTVSGSIMPYSYIWSTGDTTADLANISTPGFYQVTVTSNSGCSVTAGATLNSPSTVSVTVTTTNLACYGQGSGSGSINAGGGVSPYTYQWNDGSSLQNRTNLPTGPYSITVNDVNGCSTTTGIAITQPDLLTATTTVSQVSCNGGSNGNITLAVNGGVQPYSYHWNNNSTVQNPGNLTSGNYSLTITDSNGCKKYLNSIQVGQASAISEYHSVTNVSCIGGSNGSVTLLATGGTSPYSYIWSNGSTVQSPSGLLSGSYSVTITDSNNCTKINSAINISQPPPVNISANLYNPTCFGSADGFIFIYTTGGTSPYSILWSNGSTALYQQYMTAGTYTVTVTDNCGAIATSQEILTQPPEVTTVVNQVQPACPQSSDGSIDIMVSSGDSPFNFLWNNGETSNTTDSLSAGTYTVTIFDTHGCGFEFNILLNGPQLTVIDSITQVQCSGQCDGIINLNVNGTGTSFAYLWNNGETTEDINNLCPGSYSVTITDSGNCVSSFLYQVIATGGFTVTEYVNSVSCNGASDGSISLSPNGGLTPYIYSWSNGQGLNHISNLAQGLYSVTIQDQNGCLFTDTFTINQPSALQDSVIVINVSSFGGSDGSISIEMAEGASPYSYVWSNGALTAEIQNLPAGIYVVTITDANNCDLTDTIEVTQPGGITNQYGNKGLYLQVQPNPTNQMTTVTYYLSGACSHYLELYSEKGDKIETLLSGYLPAGKHLSSFDASKYSGGLYFIKLKLPDMLIVSKILIE